MVKLLILYFNYTMRPEHILYPEPSLIVAVYSLGLPYLFWMIRAYYQLFGIKNFATTAETFLFTDMIFHVCADLLDASAAFVFIFDSSGLDNEQWLTITDGILIGLAWFLHIYSFPSRASTFPVEEADISRRMSNVLSADVLLTRKWASLVSVFVVDLPFLAIRTYVWVNYPYSPGLQNFLLKNVISIPLGVFRFTQCRRLEKLYLAQLVPVVSVYAASSGMTRSLTPTPKRITSALMALSSLGMDYDRPHSRNAFSSPSMLPLSETTSVVRERFLSAADRHESNYSSDSREALPAQVRFDEAPATILPDEAVGKGSFVDDKPNSKFLEQIEAPRSIPVKSFGIRNVSRKIKSCLSIGVMSSYRSRALSLGPVAKWEARQLLCALIISTVVKMICPVFMVFPTGGHECHVTDDPLECATEIGSAKWELLWMLGYAVIGSSIYVACLWRLVKVKALLPSFVAQTGSFCFWWTVNRAVAFGSVRLHSPDIRHMQVLNVNHRWIVWFLSVPALTRLIRYLTLKSWKKSPDPTKDVNNVTRAPTRRRRKSMNYPSADFIKFESIPNTDISTLISELAGNQDLGLKTDGLYISSYEKIEQQGYMKYSSLLFLNVCKHTRAPIAFHQRIANSDLFKSIRLSDHLLHYNYGYLTLQLILGGLAIAFLRDLATIIVVICSLSVCLVYHLTCHAQRLLALRAYECQALAENIIKNYNSLNSLNGGYKASSEFTLNADPFLDGFFSSPGNIFPT